MIKYVRYSWYSDLTPLAPIDPPASEAVGGLTMWDKAIQQVVEIAKLKDDWDGEGSPAISLDILRSTETLLRKYRAEGHPAPNDVYPASDGFITVEWQSPGDVITRIEVDGIGTGERMVSFPDAPSQFERLHWSLSGGRHVNHMTAYQITSRSFAFDLFTNRHLNNEGCPRINRKAKSRRECPLFPVAA